MCQENKLTGRNARRLARDRVVHVEHVFYVLKHLLVARAHARKAQAQARAVLDDLGGGQDKV